MKHAAARLRVLLCAVSLAATLLSAQEAVARDAVAALRHGQDVTKHAVGPRAGGFETVRTFPGGEIRDGKTYPFARAVPASARYPGFDVAGPHLLIENAQFTSALDIYTAQPVVLLGVSVRIEGSGVAAVLTRPGAGPLYALWSDFGGREGARIDAGVMLRADNAKLYRSYLSGAADGIAISGSHIEVTESLIETRRAAPGDHNDAVQMLGAPQHVTLTRNRILNPNPQTSCVTVLGSHIKLTGNYLSGGGWSLYGGARNNGKAGGGASHVSVSDTVFGRAYFAKGGSFGPVSYWDRANIWRNNRFSDGADVRP